MGSTKLCAALLLRSTPFVSIHSIRSRILENPSMFHSSEHRNFPKLKPRYPRIGKAAVDSNYSYAPDYKIDFSFS